MQRLRTYSEDQVTEMTQGTLPGDRYMTGTFRQSYETSYFQLLDAPSLRALAESSPALF